MFSGVVQLRTVLVVTPMKLIKPPYPDPTGTGLDYCMQAAHRRTAIELAIAALQELPSDPSDQLLCEMGEAMREWTIEAIVQGAWVLGYHKWETDTKSYFDVMHVRNGQPAPQWKKIKRQMKMPSHVEIVRTQLATFSAKIPASLIVIDGVRERVNDAKHEDSYLASQSDYEALSAAIDQFWQDLESQEEFTP
jgi:hypothetical protein